MLRTLPLVALLVIAVLTLPAFAELPFQDGECVLVLGDSITQAGQYVAFFETYLWAKYPDRNIKVANLGLSSETASGKTEPGDPYNRPWIHDRVDICLELTQPDWVLVCYGMNDGIYRPQSEEGMKAYQEGITKLVEKLEAAGAKVILLTPPPYDAETQRLNGTELRSKDAEDFAYSTPYEDYDDVLAEYSAWIMTQKDEVAAVVDMHTPMREYITKCREQDEAYKYGDGVHPTEEGHYRMALAILEGLGEDYDDAQALLTKVTGETLYPDEPKEEASELRRGLLRRSKSLSSAYLRYVMRKLNGAEPPSMNEAIAAAKEREATLRPQVEELAKAVVTP